MKEEKLLSQEEFFEACEKLKADFDYLIFAAGIDYPEKNAIQLVYYLQSIENKNTLILKVDLPRENPEIHSVAVIWPAAEWHEREIFDLFGVKFTGHPDLRRILLPPEWEGHPLRKDYVKPGVVKRPETVK